MKKQFTVQTIHELLVETRGNQSELAALLGINRGTLRKYLPDTEAKFHAVVDGIFMCRSMINHPVKKLAVMPTLKQQQTKLRKEQGSRSYSLDVQRNKSELRSCPRCHLLFEGHPLRPSCRHCEIYGDYATFRQLLRQHREKLNEPR